MKTTIALCYMLLALLSVNLIASPVITYTFPKPNAHYVAPECSIILRFADAVAPNALSEITVVGSKSGTVSGTCKITKDGHTIIFTPQQHLLPEEKITVSTPFAALANYTFEIARDSHPIFPEDNESQQPANSLSKTMAPLPGATAQIMANGVAVPSDFPHINVTVNNDPAPGYIFINNWRDNNPYNIIFDSDGSPIWYLRTPDGDRRRDFKVQDDGNLSMLVRNSYPFGQGWIEMDNTYTVIDSFYAVDGYGSDEHELQVLPNGHYLLIGIRGVTVDMSRYLNGGSRNAHLSVGAVQEFNADGELIFLWDALEELEDYLIYTQSDENDNPYQNSFRFPHMNAIDIDTDGNILVSCRHLSAVFKLERGTGSIIWELGGPYSSFDFKNDDLNGFTNQHDIRALGNNHYSVFDNGNLHSPKRSRGVEYVLDEQAGTATLVWEYRNPPGTSFSHYMGNVTRLLNGNTAINWAVSDRPKISEITPDGQVAYEMNFANGYDCYRAFRLPWEGNAAKPYLLIETLPDRIQLIFNKFGDKDVKYYNIYAGKSPNPNTVVDSSKATLKAVRNLSSGLYYFRVAAVYADGSESEYSNQLTAAVELLEPGENFIQNPDFAANNANGWIWEVNSGAEADLQFENGVAHIVISNGGGNIYDVQLRQNGLPLVQGINYIFEFDAWADRSRVAEIKVGQDDGAFYNYSQVGYSALTTRSKHFVYNFTMDEPTDMNGRVVINTGTDDADVYIDNISLKMYVQTDVEENSPVVTTFALQNNYPNPFNPSTNIRYSLAENCDVSLIIYNLLGESVCEYTGRNLAAGEYNYQFDGSSLASGIYLYSLQATSKANGKIYNQIKKMTLLK